MSLSTDLSAAFSGCCLWVSVFCLHTRTPVRLLRAEALASFWHVLCYALSCVSVCRGSGELVCLCLWWGLALECPWVCMWACVCRPVCLCDVSCVCESVLCMVSWDCVFDLRLGWEGRCQNVCVCLHCQICDGWPSVYICQPFCAVCFLLGPGR